MNPAFSIIFFTATAGVGYGLLFFLGLSRSVGFIPKINPDQLSFDGIVGLVLVTAGLLSSTLHLANPKNAWRAFMRFRTSWLSREGVFAVLFYPLCLLWLVIDWRTGNTGASRMLGGLTALMCLIVLVCTAMIYASLKTIRQWHTAFTPINFILLGLMSGALLLLWLQRVHGVDASLLHRSALVLLVLAALFKIATFIWIGKPAGPTIQSALGFKQATVKLLDVGHSSDTFLTREFGYQVARVRIMWLRAIVVVCAFVLPLVLLLVGGSGGSPTLNFLAFVFACLGIYVERWLFFAEARHVVMLYHGQQHT